MNGTPTEKKYGQREVDNMIKKMENERVTQVTDMNSNYQAMLVKYQELQENYDKLKDLHMMEVETKDSLIDYIKGLEQGVKLCHNG